MNSIEVNQKELNINLTFYRFIKIINSTDGLNTNQLKKTFELICNSSSKASFVEEFELNILSAIKSEQKILILKDLFSDINNEEVCYLFIFSVYILKLKPLLLQYAKLIEPDLELKESNPLSIARDNYSKNLPYMIRVHGALISLIFFDLIERKDKSIFSTSNYQSIFINDLFNLYEKLSKRGLQANQIFMITFQESISQSGKSIAGSSLEDLVNNVLNEEGIIDIFKGPDKYNHDIEYDHFFELNERKYGISTKRTLRERYKQFKRTETAQADIFIHITSGLDLNATKAKTITEESFGCYIFVFPEIYEKSAFMINNNKIFSTADLTLTKLSELT